MFTLYNHLALVELNVRREQRARGVSGQCYLSGRCGSLSAVSGAGTRTRRERRGGDGSAAFAKTFVMTDRFICNATNAASGPLVRHSTSRQQPNIAFLCSL